MTDSTDQTYRRTSLLLRSMNVKGKTCLDIGCGEGVTVASLIDSGALLVYGIEQDQDIVSPQMRVDPQFSLMVGDATTMDLPEVDVIYCLDVVTEILAESGWDSLMALIDAMLTHAKDIFLELPSMREDGAWKDALPFGVNNDADLYKALLKPFADSIECSYDAATIEYNDYPRITWRIRTCKSCSTDG